MTLTAPTVGGLPPGTRMGRYELLHRLAMGGMAELYVARHSGIQGFERTVVLKRVLPHLTEDPEFTRMFLDEARIAASLDHPNIAQVTDIDEEAGEYFFAMEYVHGRNLREVLKGLPNGLALGMALSVITGVAAGLHHAHEALGPDGRPLGLVHRDVSPSNVMLAYSGAVKLTDFGIAKASAQTSKTVGGKIKGKVGYMSPEQCRGEEVDRRSDIFSLGIVLYETATGARAFYAPNDFAAMARIARADYTPPSQLDPAFPADLERIVARALEKDPDARYPTAEAMQLDLEAFAERNGHTLSTIELAAHLKQTFGTPPHPQTLSIERPAAPQASPAIAETMLMPQPANPGVSRRVLWSAVVGSAVLAGGVALAFGPAGSAPPTPVEASTRDPGGSDAAGGEAPEPLDARAASKSDQPPGAAQDRPERIPTEQVAAPKDQAADAARLPDANATKTGDTHDDDAGQASPRKIRRKARAKKSKRAKPSPTRSPYPPGYER